MSETAMYVVVRRDLKMRRGKEIAQGIHAMARLGYVAGLPLVVLRAESEQHLGEIVAEATGAGISWAWTTDAGLTEVAPGTITAAAIGPVAKGALSLLAAAELY